MPFAESIDSLFKKNEVLIPKDQCFGSGVVPAVTVCVGSVLHSVHVVGHGGYVVYPRNVANRSKCEHKNT